MPSIAAAANPTIGDATNDPSAYVATSVSRPNTIDVTLTPTSSSPVNINPIRVTAGNIGSRTCAA